MSGERGESDAGTTFALLLCFEMRCELEKAEDDDEEEGEDDESENLVTFEFGERNLPER